MVMLRKCQNPECNNFYEVDSKDIDDHYCSYSCWEQVNCKVPKVSEDEASLKEIFSYK